MSWRDTAPYTEEQKDRWIRVTWAAKAFGVAHAEILAWAKSGDVDARQNPSSGNWSVSERSLKAKLFGKDA